MPRETQYLQLLLLGLTVLGFSFLLITQSKGNNSEIERLDKRVAALERKEHDFESRLFKLQYLIAEESNGNNKKNNNNQPTPMSAKKKNCLQWQKQWEVVPGASWGKAKKQEQELWGLNDCDSLVQSDLPPPPLSPMPKNYDYSPTANKIAICLGSTTRTMKNPSMDKLALFKTFFPSLERTMEDGFVYMVYVGYDQGDPFFDSPGRVDTIQSWFADLFANKRKTLNITLHMLKLENKVKKPGPVFNAVLKQAYEGGSDFFFRVNDDSLFQTPWASKLRDFLIGFGPPYGAVGPWCTQGNAAILTHDFVHRLHMDIFEGVYYPPVFSDWFMDDWISRVYGRQRTRRLKTVQVEHRVSAHGRRYDVDQEHGKHLTAEIFKGRAKILRWMQDNKLPANVTARFVEDSTTFSLSGGR